MNTSTFDDKTEWGPGPWQDEPDRVQWTDAATGLPCLVRRGPSGAWCGYVGIGPEHPWYGKGYSECVDPTHTHSEDEWAYGCTPESLVEVHGGITYAEHCSGEPDKGICHVPEPGQPDHAYWFGFDCCHLGDLSPRYANRFPSLKIGGEQYRSIAYAQAEVESLALQLADERAS